MFYPGTFGYVESYDITVSYTDILVQGPSGASGIPGITGSPGKQPDASIFART